MSFIHQQKREIEGLTSECQKLQGQTDKAALILYYKTLLRLIDKQIEFYSRLSLIATTECVIEMREMTNFFERKMGKTSSVSTSQYLSTVRKEILWHLNRLTASKWD